jgi:hypothetical protein
MERGTEFAAGTGGAAAGRVSARPDSFRLQGASRRRPAGTRGEQEATPAGGPVFFFYPPDLSAMAPSKGASHGSGATSIGGGAAGKHGSGDSSSRGAAA